MRNRADRAMANAKGVEREKERGTKRRTMEERERANETEDRAMGWQREEGGRKEKATFIRKETRLPRTRFK